MNLETAFPLRLQSWGVINLRAPDPTRFKSMFTLRLSDLIFVARALCRLCFFDFRITSPGTKPCSSAID